MEQDYSYSPDYAEYITGIVSDKKYSTMKVLIVFAAILCVIGEFILFSAKPAFVFIALLLFFATFYGVWFLWKYTSVEYEYCIALGEMQFDAIYAARTRKKFYSCKISKMSKIGKLADFKNPNKLRVISAISNKAPENSYYAIVETETGENQVLLFEANEKILKIIKTFNLKAFM